MSNTGYTNKHRVWIFGVWSFVNNKPDGGNMCIDPPQKVLCKIYLPIRGLIPFFSNKFFQQFMATRNAANLDT